MKIRPVAAELFHADGRTDRHDEANNHILQFLELARKGLQGKRLEGVCRLYVVQG